jgi:hypothetical protein
MIFVMLKLGTLCAEPGPENPETSKPRIEAALTFLAAGAGGG